MCGVKFAMDDAGLAAVVGIELDGLVSGDSPAMDCCDVLPVGTTEALFALGVADRRPLVLWLDRQRSLVKSTISPAMASKAAE